jgi:Reverse transcriptase (RNA-dependent DNA polymerase)
VQRGVPQGSVLGPILFLLYVSDVVSIVTECGFIQHAYADDLQVYGHTDSAQSSELLAQMAESITRAEAWMASNRLRLNPAKTEAIWLGSSRRLAGCLAQPLTLPGVSIQPSSTVRDLGVNLSMEAQVSQATSACFFYLRQLRLVRLSLSDSAVHTLVRAVIYGRLDYCNGLFASLPANQISRLQSVLRAAARLVLRLPGQAPVSDVMRDTLHWLSFPQRVTYKLCVLTYKCLHDLVPPYLSRCCIPLTTVPGRSQLRSADDRKLFVPRTRTVTFGPRAFCCSGPSAWNDLPSSLHHRELSLNVFRQQLKTALF